MPLWAQIDFCTGQFSYDQEICGLKIWYGEWLAFHRIPAGILHPWNHYETVNAVSSSRVVVILDRNILMLRSNCN